MIPVLPYTAEVLASLVGRYNAAYWPLPAFALCLAVGAALLAVRPAPRGGRIAAGLLALAWAWVGIGFHIRTAGQIDFMAPAYGGFFLVQAALLAWTGVLRGNLAPGFRPDVAGWTGLGLAAFAIVGYPAMATLAGRSWPALPLAGMTPDATAMLTFGLLLILRPVRRHLLAVPAMWSAVAGMTALSLGTAERLVLPAAALLALALSLRPPAAVNRK